MGTAAQEDRAHESAPENFPEIPACQLCEGFPRDLEPVTSCPGPPCPLSPAKLDLCQLQYLITIIIISVTLEDESSVCVRHPPGHVCSGQLIILDLTLQTRTWRLQEAHSPECPRQEVAPLASAAACPSPLETLLCLSVEESFSQA